MAAVRSWPRLHLRIKPFPGALWHKKQVVEVIRKAIENWRSLWILWFLSVLVVLLAVLAWVDFIESAEEKQRWQLFKEEHNCKITEHKKGQLSDDIVPMIGPDGDVTVAVVARKTPDQVGWLCDDGVTYWR